MVSRFQIAKQGFLSLGYVSLGALICFGLSDCNSQNRVSSPVMPARGEKGDKTGNIRRLDKTSQTGLSYTTVENAHNGKAAVGFSTGKKAKKPSRVFIGSDLDEEWILSRLVSEPPTGFVSVGNTSVVFRMSFNTQPHAAFKPATRRRPGGHVAEIAAYRLGRCLGINNVPPVVSRRISRKTLLSGLTIKRTTVWRKLDARIRWDKDGFVQGAAIYWVPAMRNLNLESRSEMHRWLRWLEIDNDVSNTMRPLAKEISNMVSFDYLIGNGDRFSGGNIKGDPQRRFLFLRDHDLAFPRILDDTLHRRIANRMLFAERFSRRFFHGLRELTRKALLRELERDPLSAEGPLLDDRQLAGLFDRREALLSHITSLIQLHGEDRVLAFP